MTVTLLIPVFKAEQFIGTCAESLFAQTYPDIEYVFYDDCTPDNSIEVVKQIAIQYPERQSHVHILRGDCNRGIGHARKQLVEAVESETFAFVDSDDRLPLDAIEILVKRMRESQTDIVDGAICYWTDGKLQAPELPSHATGPHYQHSVMCQNLVPHHLWGRLYRREVLKRVPNLFVEGVDLAEDCSACMRLVAVTTRSWTDQVVYHYRVDNQSWFNGQTSEKKMRSYLRAYKLVLSFYHQRGHLPFAVEVGLLNMYRVCKQNNCFSPQEIDQQVGYVPEHLTAQLLFSLFHHKGLIHHLADTLYRIVRIIASR